MSDLLSWTSGKLQAALGLGLDDARAYSEVLVGIQVTCVAYDCQVCLLKRYEHSVNPDFGFCSHRQQDEQELSEFVAGMLPGEDAANFLKELNTKRKHLSHSGGNTQKSAAPIGHVDSNIDMNSASAPSIDAGRRRNVDEYRDLLHLSGRCFSRFEPKIRML